MKGGETMEWLSDNDGPAHGLPMVGSPRRDGLDIEK